MKAGFKFDVLVTTYEIFSTNLQLFTPINWQYVIVDEAHKLKNLGSKATESLLKLRYDHITLLTGLFVCLMICLFIFVKEHQSRITPKSFGHSFMCLMRNVSRESKKKCILCVDFE